MTKNNPIALKGFISCLGSKPDINGKTLLKITDLEEMTEEAL